MSHSLLSPSAAYRWTACPASVLHNTEEDEPGPAAREGILAHEIAASRLRHGATHEGEIPNIKMVEHTTTYIRNIESMAPDSVYSAVEEWVDCSFVLGHDPRDDTPQGGTADYVAVVKRNGIFELQIHDLKYGKGIAVSARENPQLMIYGAGLLERLRRIFPIRKIILAIHQPRINQTLSVHSVDPITFAKSSDMIATAALKCLDMFAGKQAPEYVYGEKQCRWCQYKAECPALRQGMIDAVCGGSVEEKPKNPYALSNEELAKILSLEPIWSGWMAAVKTLGRERLLDGQEIPGFKIVAGRAGKRKWFDAETVAAILENAKVKTETIYKQSLITPTQAEKILAPPIFAKVKEYISKPARGPVLAPVDDPRQNMKITSEVFEDMTK